MIVPLEIWFFVLDVLYESPLCVRDARATCHDWCDLIDQITRRRFHVHAWSDLQIPSRVSDLRHEFLSGNPKMLMMDFHQMDLVEQFGPFTSGNLFRKSTMQHWRGRPSPTQQTPATLLWFVEMSDHDTQFWAIDLTAEMRHRFPSSCLESRHGWRIELVAESPLVQGYRLTVSPGGYAFEVWVYCHTWSLRDIVPLSEIDSLSQAEIEQKGYDMAVHWNLDGAPHLIRHDQWIITLDSADIHSDTQVPIKVRDPFTSKWHRISYPSDHSSTCCGMDARTGLSLLRIADPTTAIDEIWQWSPPSSSADDQKYEFLAWAPDQSNMVDLHLLDHWRQRDSDQILCWWLVVSDFSLRLIAGQQIIEYEPPWQLLIEFNDFFSLSQTERKAIINPCWVNPQTLHLGFLFDANSTTCSEIRLTVR